jgi:O-antigen/teichoic acid export membrane protein
MTSMVRRKLSVWLSGDSLRARIIRGGIGSAGIQAANRFLALALGIVLARLLGPDGYGVYAYAFAIMSLLMVVAEAGVPTLLMREVAASQVREEWELLSGALHRGFQFVALTAMTVSSLGLLLLWWLADNVSAMVLYTTALMLLVLPVAALCKTVAHVLQGLNKVVVGQAVDMLIRPLLVLVFVAVLFVGWPQQQLPQVAMAAQLLGSLIVLFIGVRVLMRFLPGQIFEVAPSYKSRLWLKSALPFTLIGGAMIINTQADIIMIGWFLNSESVGVYRVVSQGALMMTFILQAASAVLRPSFAKFYAAGNLRHLDNLYQKSTRVIMISTLPIVIAFVVMGGEILGFVFGSKYVVGASALAILAVGYFANISFGAIGSLMQMIGQEKSTAFFLWVTSVFNVILNLLLIPLFGLNGAAIATAITVFSYHAALWFKYRQVVVGKGFANG